LFRKFVLALTFLPSFSSAGVAATPDIGTTVAVKNEVMLESGPNEQPLSVGAAVHQDEIIITRAGASAEVELLDKTKLAVGSDARIVLDKFVYNASTPAGSISVNLSKGAFRFITGIAAKKSYEIKTPTASLGVRGTVFDVYVANNGETAVLLHHGAVELCNLAGICRLQDGVGAILFVSENGVISTYSRCGHSFIHTIGLETAFPFIGKTLKVDPVRRMSVRDFECLPADQPPVITTQGPPPPSPPSPPQFIGPVFVGGLILGLPILENHPASP